MMWRYVKLILLITICTIPLLVSPCLLSASDQEPKRILVLNSYHQGSSWSDPIMEAIQSEFARSDLAAELYFEYMDTRRYRPSEVFPHLSELFRSKYRNTPFDLIISSDKNALDFALKLRTELFPDTPMVFCGIAKFQKDMLADVRNITGIVETLSHHETIEQALTLHPETTDILVIGDPQRVTGRRAHELLLPDVQQHQDRLNFTFWDKRPIEDIVARLKDLPKGYLVLQYGPVMDRSGHVLTWTGSTEKIRQVLEVPMYSFWEVLLGYGIVGGKMVSPNRQGELATQLALRILGGENPGHIPVITTDANQFMFDHRELERFGISPGLLPEKSIVINSPPSFYQVNKRMWWIFLGVTSGLIVFASVLLRNISSRRQTEQQLWYREAFERLIAGISTRFVELAPSETDQGIDLALQELGRFAGVDRSYVFLLSADGGQVNNSHEWCAEQIAPQKENLQGIAVSELPWAIEKLLSRQVLYVPSMAELPPEAEAEKTHWQAQEIQSLITVPILSAAKVIGFLGFDAVRSEKLWSERDQALLQTVGEIFGNAIERQRAVELLKEREATLRSILAAAPIGIGLSQGLVLQWGNKNLFEMLGRTAEEESSIGTITDFEREREPETIFEREGELERVQQEIEQAIVEKGIGEVETRWKRKDGSVIDVLLSSAPIDPSDTSAGGTFTAMDITERKRAEEALKEREATLNSILTAAPIGIGLTQNRVLRWVGQNLLKMLGYSAEQLIGKSARILYESEEEFERVGQVKYQAIAERGTGEVETRWVCQDGSVIDVLLSSSPIEPSNLAAGVTFTALDITDRKRAKISLQKALTKAEEARDKIETILKSVADGLIFTDMDNRIIMMSASAESMLDKKLSGIFLQPLDEAVAELNLGEHIAAIKTDGEHEVTLELELQDGNRRQERIIQVKSSLVRGQKGVKAGVITLLRDISRERELDRMKSEFISTAAHELRTPLTSIRGYAQILLTGKGFDAEQQQEFLSIINEKTEVLEKITEDLLDLSRVESGRVIHVEKSRCVLASVLNNVIDQYQKECQSYHFETILPEQQVEPWMDKGKIVQVMENLLSNAVKFSSEGSRIHVACETSPTDVRVSVRDEGIGMTPEQVERVFDKFYRVDASNTAAEGLGLGMAIAKSIIEAHNGNIWVKSELGRGTTISFALPLD